MFCYFSVVFWWEEYYLRCNYYAAMSQIPKDARTCYSDKANTDSIAVRKLIQLSTHQHSTNIIISLL